MTAQIVFAAAADGDPVSEQICTMLLERLGRGIASIAMTVNPDLVLIGGGITNAGDAVLGPIRTTVERLTPHPPTVAISSLGGNGTVLGAVRRAMEIADQSTFSFSAGLH